MMQTKIKAMEQKFESLDADLLRLIQQSSEPDKTAEILSFMQSEILKGMLSVYEFEEYYREHKNLLGGIPPFELLKILSASIMPLSKDSLLKNREDQVLRYAITTRRDYSLDVDLIWREQVFKDSFLNSASQIKNLDYRVVKGLPQILYGRVAGAFTGTDMALYEDTRFKLIQMSDTDTGKVVGFIQVYQFRFLKKKYLFIPGFYPASEYENGCPAKSLYSSMMKAVNHFAAIHQYSFFYIPSNPDIHSSNKKIQAVIAEHVRKGIYQEETLPFEMEWSVEKPHPFNNVYKIQVKADPQKPIVVSKP